MNAQGIATLADGVMLLCALALLLWPRPSAARWVLLAATALLGLGGVAAATTVATRLLALGIAGVSGLVLWRLYRADPEPRDPDSAPSPWPRLLDGTAPGSAQAGTARDFAATWPALGFVLLLVLSVFASGRLEVGGSALGAPAHARASIAIGLTVLLAGVAVCARSRAAGLVQVAGPIIALQAVGWVGVRLAGASGDPLLGGLAAFAGAPAGVLAAVLLAMRASSATVRVWLLQGPLQAGLPADPAR